MIRALLVLMFMTAPAVAETLEPTKTWAVVSGVLEWKDRGLSAFPKEHRKDQELFDQLATMGVPIAQRRLLIDAHATTDHILEALGDTIDRAPAGSTLIFYFAGHGLKDKDGRIVFASVDVSTQRVDDTGLHLDDLVPLFQRFKGQRIILMADCCYSGGLGDVAARLGKNVVVLTSSEASNTSTGNWTFTQTVLDALRGSEIVDRDHDGKVELGELGAEIASAMKHREQQRSLYIGADDLVLAKTVDDPTIDGAHDWVLARRGDALEPARVLAKKGGQMRVAFYDYSDYSDAWVAPKDTKKLDFKTWPVGTKLTVKWSGAPWAAEVTAVSDGFMKITYPGWKSSWDEWITAARVIENGPAEVATGEKLEVLWEGKWYGAIKTGTKGELTCIHYVGYEASWDECVTPDRVR